MNKSQISPLYVYILLAMLPASACADTNKGKFKVSSGALYTSGDYGSTQKTSMFYMPVTFKYKRDKWDFKLTVPYLKIRGPHNVVFNIGKVNQSVVSVTDTKEGLGDISFTSKYRLAYLPKSKTLMDLAAKVKFGTADEDKNLGTGKTDFSLTYGLYQLVGDFTPYLKVGRKFYGDPDRYALDDVFFSSLGLGYKYSPSGSIGINLYLKEKTASTRSSTRQLTAYLDHKLDKNWTAQAYVIEGLSDNTPDFGAGFSLAYQFD